MGVCRIRPYNNFYRLYFSFYQKEKKMIEFDEVIEFDEAKYEDNIARHTFPVHQGKGDDTDE